MDRRKKDKTLTTRFDSQTMAEFAVAVEILGARSINAMVHQMVHQKITEAKSLISRTEFERMVDDQKQQTAARSAIYKRDGLPNSVSENHGSRVEILGELMPRSTETLPIIEAAAETETPKKKRSA